MSKYLTEGEIKQGIEEVRTASASLVAKIHTLAVSAGVHSLDSGNLQLCTDLVHAMHKGMRRNALIQWFCTYGTMEYDGIGDKGRFKKKGKKMEFNAERANLDPFYEQKSVKEGEEWNAKLDLARIVGIVKKHVEKAQEHKNETLAKKYQDALNILTV